MNQYNSYYLYQQYEKRGSQDWLPCYPNIFSVDGDGTMPLVMKKENDPDCGYTGDTEPIYRWYPLPITTDYICDECPVVTYRWENMDVSTDYYCNGTTKYYKQIRQYSYDSGTTWYDVVPPEYQQGSVYEQQSTDCGYVPPIEPQYRTTSGTPYCEGYDKYVEVYSQVSYDGGITWSTTATTPTLVEHKSQDCGYVPPIPFDGKIRLSYSNGDVYSAACDSNTTLTSGETRPAGYTHSDITTASLGSCVTSIGDRAFSYCTGLTSIDIPSSVTSIGNRAFQACSLTSVTIGSGITSIDNYAFVSCSGLTGFEIPSGVTSIGSGAFRYCRSLTGITVNATTPPILGNNAFDETNDCPIYVPYNSVNAYKSAWSSYSSRITSLEQHRATSGSPYCTGYDKYVDVYNEVSYDAGATWATASTTPTLVEHNSTDCGYVYEKIRLSYANGDIYTAACNSNTTLTTGETRPAGYTYTAMTSAVIGDCVRYMDNNAFKGCTSLTSVTIGSGIITVSSAFSGCTSLTSIDIPDNVTSIYASAFTYCTSLASVTIGSGVTSIGADAFYYCSGLTSLTIGSSVTDIGKDAFERCMGLTSVTIPESVENIGDYAFNRCMSLTSITVNAYTPPTLHGTSTFDNTNNCPIYVPYNRVNAYKSASYWDQYKSRIQAKL